MKREALLDSSKRFSFVAATDSLHEAARQAVGYADFG
ncbi:MAG: hypothetical protein H6Q33_3379, partial [Deltaproteobacteria bacterium]|nr:hypothetical protein [Deltaproteobacteria bacterium]